MKKLLILLSICCMSFQLFSAGGVGLLPPAWTYRLPSAWNGRKYSSAWSMNNANSLNNSSLTTASSNQSSSKLIVKWLCVYTYSDQYGNAVSDSDSKIFDDESEATSQFNTQCRLLVNDGWKELRVSSGSAVYEKNGMICNVFTKTVYVKR